MNLEYFAPHEFREWADRMSLKLKARLDVFRFRWGAPVRVSKHPGALGRSGAGTSQHNWEQFDELRAIDVHLDGLIDRSSAERAIALATECGFTGIGLYPHWRPQPGLHLDVREATNGVRMGSPALWGMVRQYPDKPPGPDNHQLTCSLEEALQAISELNR